MNFKLKNNSPIKQETPPGKVKYGTPEYKSAYDKGEVLGKDGTRSPIALDEVTIKAKPKKEGFWKQSINKYTKEHAGDGLFEALGSVVTYPMQVPQDAATYATTGKVQRPSEALNIKNKVGAAVTDMALDPVNLIGGGSVVKGAVKAGINKLSKKALAPIVEQGTKEVTRQVEGLIPKQRKLSAKAQAAKDQVGRTSFSNFGDASDLPRKDYVTIYTENKVKAPGFKGKQLEQRLKHGKENVAKALNANLDWVESNRYTRNRSANTGETEKEVVASVNDYKRRFMNTKLNFLDDPTGETSGSYNTVIKDFNDGSTRQIHSIEAEVKTSRFRGKYAYRPESTLDHEIGHAFSPTQKNNKLYKDYPLIKTNERIRGEKKGKIYDKIKDLPYLDKPSEQQVRMKRLSQSIRKDFDLGQEKRLTTKHVESYKNSKSWVGNNPSYVWYESGDVADLFMSSPKKYSSTANLTKHLNKAWTAPVVTAGVAGTMMNKSKKK